MKVIFRRIAPILLAAIVAFGGLPGLGFNQTFEMKEDRQVRSP